ncbi:SDR family oxidoreductase [Rubrobacter indicoceani]|uniref:SDR family oxidoreductase n=1 Tax=Rubrobacter indicoceani TaxID=2051957 RepID=UPI000E5AEC7A|nr:SDR family NAD(P)-dependent oxidoreductase [Rubrobacter indicoceani]
MPGSLAGKTAVVTGASSGVGLEATKLLLDSGARVHAVARRRDAMLGGVGEERASSGDFTAHAMDVSDQGAVEKLVNGIGESDGIDALVLAAGMNVPDRKLDRLTPETWDRMLSVNLSGAFYFVHAALPFLKESRGDAIFIASVSGTWPDVSGAAYQASKLGMIGLARAAGFEEHENGVRFSTILPGIIDTPILDNRPEPPPKAVRDAALKPEDVAAACQFLLTLPPHVHVPELTMVPTRLQALGKTGVATPKIGDA